MSVVVTMMAMVRLAAAFAAKLAARATCNVVFAMRALMGFFQDIFIPEFTPSRTTTLVVLFLGFIIVLVVLYRFFVNLATVSLVVLTVMLLVCFVPVMGHYNVFLS